MRFQEHRVGEISGAPSRGGKFVTSLPSFPKESVCVVGWVFHQLNVAILKDRI